MASSSAGGDPDVVIVGAGINGCVSARALAPDHDVLVLDKGPVAGETTGKASGLVSVVHDYEHHLGAARYAVDFFKEYDGTRNFEYTRRSNVELLTPENVDERTAAADMLLEEGFDVEVLDAEAVEERFPDVFVLDEFAGALEYKEEGWVDPYTLTVTYKEDAEAEGATFRTGVEVTGFTTEAGEVTGVETTEGPVSADTVVVATGWRTREMVAEWVDLPIRPFRYQTINLETDRGFEDWYPIAWEPMTGLYWRPEHNGDLHVGGGTYFPAEPPDVRSNVTDEFRRLVADVIGDYVKGIEDATIAGDGICPEGDAATPDSLAIFDEPDGAPDGLVVATGMEGFGIMASPVTGAAVRSIVADEPVPFDMEKFAADRFDVTGTDWSSDYIVEEPAELLEPRPEYR